jgi:hypothetical protein
LTGFDDKIKKKIVANEGSTKWRGRRARLEACIAKKNINMWEVKYAEFNDYDGMPETTSTSYKWQSDQLAGFDGKIKKKIAANNGSTNWRGRSATQSLHCKKEYRLWEVKYAEFDDYDGMSESKSA